MHQVGIFGIADVPPGKFIYQFNVLVFKALNEPPVFLLDAVDGIRRRPSAIAQNMAAGLELMDHLDERLIFRKSPFISFFDDAMAIRAFRENVETFSFADSDHQPGNFGHLSALKNFGGIGQKRIDKIGPRRVS
jgi:hypothetical protein